MMSDQNPNSNPAKRKRNLPGNPDPDAEVIALSPKSLMATNRFLCEICNKGFQRDQNLQLHRRGHNLPWKLKQRNHNEVIKKKVYVCPEKSCIHHEPSRALGDLTGIKKHFSRKHGEKKWKCEKCSKKYAVQSDWKAHSKICGTREYKCDCGTIFSRKDSFITHRAFCDALTEENTRFTTGSGSSPAFQPDLTGSLQSASGQQKPLPIPLWLDNGMVNSFSIEGIPQLVHQSQWPKEENINKIISSTNNLYQQEASAYMSATALLQKASQIGSTRSNNSGLFSSSFGLMGSSLQHNNVAVGTEFLLGDANIQRRNLDSMMMGDKSMTRDFLGVVDNGGSRRLLDQEIGNFMSMGSAMDLGTAATTSTTHHFNEEDS
ncbi:zinc finger protein BALDIBIS-like [Impatiens glandulifera]|uniref:zinc finger protein BALDIBIS-like n=1 Tax=Impatiens glandulifera TaxID=253017 RepID=UPI001FB0A239|nr:zinc finger protein BALDIBIS-like [Impatiens glandulifera]